VDTTAFGKLLSRVRANVPILPKADI